MYVLTDESERTKPDDLLNQIAIMAILVVKLTLVHSWKQDPYSDNDTALQIMELITEIHCNGVWLKIIRKDGRYFMIDFMEYNGEPDFHKENIPTKVSEQEEHQLMKLLEENRVKFWLHTHCGLGTRGTHTTCQQNCVKRD